MRRESEFIPYLKCKGNPYVIHYTTSTYFNTLNFFLLFKCGICCENITLETCCKITLLACLLRSTYMMGLNKAEVLEKKAGTAIAWAEKAAPLLKKIQAAKLA